MDRIEKTIFKTLNEGSEVSQDVFEAKLLKRFKKLTAKELWDRVSLLERNGKIGWFNGYLHSNFPVDFYERIMRKESFSIPMPNQIVKCFRCGNFIAGSECITVGNRGYACKPCYKILARK